MIDVADNACNVVAPVVVSVVKRPDDAVVLPIGVELMAVKVAVPDTDRLLVFRVPVTVTSVNRPVLGVVAPMGVLLIAVKLEAPAEI